VHLDAKFACRLSSGLTEEDFIGESVREPLCSCLHKVATALSVLPVDGQMVKDALEWKAAADSLKVGSNRNCIASAVYSQLCGGLVQCVLQQQCSAVGATASRAWVGGCQAASVNAARRQQHNMRWYVSSSCRQPQGQVHLSTAQNIWWTRCE
jgi:hypothetical protein